ncbi:MAG: heme lyase CcmF/NrfE family subunit [Thermomicrobiales bacterium]
MAQIGQGILTLALAMAILGIGLSIVGERRRIPELANSGLRALIGVTVLLILAAAVLMLSFVNHDFSLAYVSGRSSTDMPLQYVITAFYGGQAGSLLLWSMVAGILASIAFYRNRARFPRLVPYATATTLAVLSFLIFMLVVVATPFAVNHITPAEGRGLNPLLRDPGMMIHPPMLLSGFASFTVPFSIVVAALITGRMGSEWLKFIRNWALISWGILSAGIFLGGWWAYHVLGWGGYWAWDPVENVSVLPWFTVTAFIHSIIVQERRGMLRVWNVGLILASFVLSIMGTFIVRSGLISSVHAFALSDIGPYFLGFFVTTMVISIGLIIYRLPLMRATGGVESAASREAGFLLNNLLFVAIAFATLWGTLYPLVTEAVRGTAITVGIPFYNQVNGPMLLALLFLMGIGPLFAWRTTARDALIRATGIPLGVSIIAIVVILFLFGQPMAALGIGAAIFAAGAVVVEYYRGVRLRQKNAGDSVPVAIFRLARRDPRRYGGYIVHLGVALIAVGIIGSWFFQSERQVIVAPGETVDLAGYSITYDGLSTKQNADNSEVTANVTISEDGNEEARLGAKRFFYRGFEDQPTTRVAVTTVGFDDVYVMLLEWTDDQRANLRIFVNPLVTWIWAGGALYLFGMIVLAWPAPAVQPVRAAAPAKQGGMLGEPAS